MPPQSTAIDQFHQHNLTKCNFRHIQMHPITLKPEAIKIQIDLKIYEQLDPQMTKIAQNGHVNNGKEYKPLEVNYTSNYDIDIYKYT